MSISHDGGINGFNTIENRLIGDHDLIVAFNNTPGAILTDLASGIRAILYGQEPKIPKRSLSQDLSETVAKSGVDAAIAQSHELKRASPDKYEFDKNALNNLGYGLRDKGRFKDAITIFKLNSEEHPKSGNVYDSLAEAYARNGQKQLGIENYRKSAELDTKNQNAIDKLKELQTK